MKRVATPTDEADQALVLKQARTGNGSVSEPEVSNGGSAPLPLLPQNASAMKVEENAQASGDNGTGEDDDDGLKITDTETFNTDRYKAFTMLVRHCVDCNLDRMTPISQQPRHKIEEIARACTRQFPEFSEQLCRSRIRSYLKSSRRNGKKHGGVICEKKRSLPSTLTSPAAERLFEQALKLELENQERIAKGLEPIQAPLPTSVAQPIIPLSTLNPEPEAAPGDSDMPPPPSLTICGNGSGKVNGSATPVPVTAHQSVTASAMPTAANLSCKTDTVERQLLAAAAAGAGDVAAELGVTDLSTGGAGGSGSSAASLLPDPVQVQLLSLLMPQLLSCAAGVAQQSGAGGGANGGANGGVAGMQNFVRECRSVSTFLFAVAEFWEAMLKGPGSSAGNSGATSCATSSSNAGSQL